MIHPKFYELLFEIFSVPRSIDPSTTALQVNTFGFFEKPAEASYLTMSAGITGIELVDSTLQDVGTQRFAIEQILTITGNPVVIGSVNVGSSNVPDYIYTWSDEKTMTDLEQVEYLVNEPLQISWNFDLAKLDIHPDFKELIVEIFRDGTFSGTADTLNTISSLTADAIVCYTGPGEAIENSGNGATVFTGPMECIRVPPGNIIYRQALTANSQMTIGSFAIGRLLDTSTLIFEDLYDSFNCDELFEKNEITLQQGDIIEISYQFGFEGGKKVTVGTTFEVVAT